MTPVQAVLANNYSTSSSAATMQTTSAEVVYLGVVATRPAEPHAGAREEPIDYGAGAAALVAAPDVTEVDSPSAVPSSPFGI